MPEAEHWSLSGRPSLRVLFVALAGFLVIALWVPEARPLAMAGIFITLIASMFSRRSARRRAATESAKALSPWPDRGIKTVLQAMNEPAFLTDSALTLRFRNAASEVSFGSFALGDPISMRFRSPELVAAADAAFASGQPRTVELLERSGKERYFQVDVLPLPGADAATPSFLLFLMRDKTAERSIEKMRTDFVANASHELRTPLASLIGFIETLQGPARNDVAAREKFLNIMREQAGRMSRLIDDLLSLSRIETKPRIDADERADLAVILSSICDAMEKRAAEAGLAFSLQLDTESGVVNGNHDELAQVFANLAENAVKYAGGGEKVVLGVRPVDREPALLEAYVQDFGRGIPAEHVPRLTERFYRVEDGAASKAAGTGLGLSIVRNILQRHGTRLQVHSEAGIGTVFSIRLRKASQ
ncbi:two-component sensor histidine kinase [Aureimonas fodinaquatilis]|uniref:histidine kinase n=1 Tax=Aureimonas fodinaquatilis TaxID=2565783 RepID=A0A5B0E1A6_9HYPH|nr:ATP-binding protein [Aureimonas fodinaquatilis]KAA0972418.1 two-component sensor histidine kinase [Aureimonas fodinaquatilis]